MNTYKLQSQLAQYIEGLIREKRAAGYKYDSQSKTLEMFDRFLIDQGFNDGSLTRETVMSWASQRPTECKNYRNNRGFRRQAACVVYDQPEQNRIYPKTFCR